MESVIGVIYAIGTIAIPSGIYWLYRWGTTLTRLDWATYLLAVGLSFVLWEMPVTTYLSLTGEESQSLIGTLLFVAFIAFTASLWDGGIVVAGLVLVRWLLDGPYFERFRLAEAAILIVWAVIFAFGVETMAVIYDMWEYPTYWWNPALYRIEERAVVFCATIGWGPIALLFYLFILRLNKRLTQSVSG